VILVGLAIDQIAQSGLSSLSVIYYSAQLFRARIGSKIFSGRYYSGVQSIDQSNINILGISLSKDGTTFSSSIEFGIDQIPTIDASNIVVNLVA
ncbi:hypothetical protein QAA85_22505, partial [Serratia nevei]|nr:hypothetical protein [Serratia nevei]